VALVNMPTASTQTPSMQLGLLQAILQERGFPTTTHYLNLYFAARFGWELHEHLAWHAYRLLGEWLFARAAFRDRAPEGQRYLDLFAGQLGPLAGFPKHLLDLRERQVPAFIEACLALVPWERYDVVGFSSVFEQNCAALALARRLKEACPRLTTVFGGANFEGEMGLEYVRALPWIDYAVIGEGDEVFPALLDALETGADPGSLRGVASRDGDAARFAGRAPLVRDLDALPTPAYRDFFVTAEALRRPAPSGAFQVQVPFESARGCWWGAKHQCNFCGLNGHGMAYRSKTPARVLAEIDELARRYAVDSLGAVDNILDHRYVPAVFGPLAEQDKGYHLFYEVKANLTRAQLRTMARGGVRCVQPGIESLSTHILKLMRKGTTALQNVAFLKWTRYYDIDVLWNFLVGLPGERLEDYEQQVAIARLIPHLPPPMAASRIHIDRFSPYFDYPEAFGIRDLRPHRAYACTYPADLDPARIAYFFDYEAAQTVPLAALAALDQCLRQWRDAWLAPERPELRYQLAAELLTVDDRRWADAPRRYEYHGAAARAYEFCGLTERSLQQVVAHFQEHGLPAEPARVQHDLDEFVAAGLMLQDGGHFLSLALPAEPD
jgi:ribosomal peptide maturation radical SAM protein 1